MKVEKNEKVVRHLFICTRQREDKPSCGGKDSAELVKILKTKVKDAGLKPSHKVTASGCLGPCAFGISAVMYPEGDLYTELTLDDAEKLFQILTQK